jgi:hypothetical protein
MGRTVAKAWRYSCDHVHPTTGQFDCHLQVDVRTGQACNTGRGTVVNDQADADAAMRADGWTVGRRVLCPTHKETARA